MRRVNSARITPPSRETSRPVTTALPTATKQATPSAPRARTNSRSPGAASDTTPNAPASTSAHPRATAAYAGDSAGSGCPTTQTDTRHHATAVSRRPPESHPTSAQAATRRHDEEQRLLDRHERPHERGRQPRRRRPERRRRDGEAHDEREDHPSPPAFARPPIGMAAAVMFSSDFPSCTGAARGSAPS